MTRPHKELKGRTVYGRKACKGKTGTITEIREPDHPRNYLKAGLYEALIEYPGYVGAEAVTLERLKNDEVNSWTLDEDQAEGQ